MSYYEPVRIEKVDYNDLAKNKRAWSKQARTVISGLSQTTIAPVVRHNTPPRQPEAIVTRTFTPTAVKPSTRIATNGIRFELGQWNKQITDSGQISD